MAWAKREGEGEGRKTEGEKGTLFFLSTLSLFSLPHPPLEAGSLVER